MNHDVDVQVQKKLLCGSTNLFFFNVVSNKVRQCKDVLAPTHSPTNPTPNWPNETWNEKEKLHQQNTPNSGECRSQCTRYKQR